MRPRLAPRNDRLRSRQPLCDALHAKQSSLNESAESHAYPPRREGLFNIGLLHTCLSGTKGHANYAPTSAALAARVTATVQTLNPKGTNAAVPIDLATASASGLDPDISPAAAYYQLARVATERHMSEDAVRSLVTAHITPRQFGLLGEPRVNVLELNLYLDKMAPIASK